MTRPIERIEKRAAMITVVQAGAFGAEFLTIVVSKSLQDPPPVAAQHERRTRVQPGSKFSRSRLVAVCGTFSFHPDVLLRCSR
jgi:hypothetical protein